jgi:hypothetical protein
MRKRLLGLSVSILLLTAFSASAESEFGQDLGGYVALSGMYIRNYTEDMDGVDGADNLAGIVYLSGLEDVAGHTGGVTARIGYRLGPMAAIEIQGDWNMKLGETDVVYQETGDAFPVAAQTDGFALTMNLRVYPLTTVIDGWVGSRLEHRIQPYVVGGFGLVTTNWVYQRGGIYRFDRVLSGAYRVGGGIDFYVSKQVALTTGVDWVDGMGRLNDLGYLSASLGVQYNF